MSTSTGQFSREQLFAKLVLRKQWASVDEINRCIELTRTLRNGGEHSTSLDRVMVREGLLTELQVKDLYRETAGPELLACPDCSMTYNVPDYSADQHYACIKCDTQLIVASAQQRAAEAAPPAPPDLARKPSAPDPPRPPTPSPPAASGPAIDVNDSQLRVQLNLSVGGVGGEEEDSLELEIPQGWDDRLCGSVVGGYRILKKLGQGGMGVIYKAEQMSLSRIVALKMLNDRLASDEQYLTRFINEAKFVARVNHPNLIQIYDVGADQGRYYFSMEYVQGECVGDYLDRKGAFAPMQALDVLIQVAQALVEAHRNGIVHRDIKPDNIILTAGGAAKLADLGIAKVEDAATDSRTEIGMQMGTPYYISPEQAANAAAVDIRADVYSLGATFFHMLTGRVPYTGKTPAVVYMKLARDPVPEASEINPEVPWSLSAMCRRMMSKDPAERPPDPQQVLLLLVEMRQELKEGKTKRPSLAQHKMMRIDAPSEMPLGGLDLAESTANRRPSSKGLDVIDGPDRASLDALPTDAGSLTDDESFGDRAFSGKKKRPKGKKGPPAQIYVYIGLAAVVGLVALVVFKSLGGPDRPIGPPPTPTKGDGGQPGHVTRQQRDERAAKAAWAPLDEADMTTLDKAGLDRLEQRMRALRRQYPNTSVVPEIDKRLAAIFQDRERRRFDAMLVELEPLAKARSHRKALARLNAYLATIDAEHSQWTRAGLKIKEIQSANQAETRSLTAQVQQLERDEKYAEALAVIRDNGSRLTEWAQRELEKPRSRLERVLRQSRLKRTILLYGKLLATTRELTSRNKYAEAATLAEQQFPAALDETLPRDQILGDYRALATGWKTLVEALQARIGQSTELRFVGESRAAPRQIVSFDTRHNRLRTRSSFKSLPQLHEESLVAYSGSALAPTSDTGKLRLAMLLHSLKRPERVMALGASLQADAPERRRFDLWQFCLHSGRIEALLDQAEKTALTEALEHILILLTRYEGSERLGVIQPQIRAWRDTAVRGLRAGELWKDAQRMERRRDYAGARLRCQLIVSFFVDPGLSKLARGMLQRLENR